MIAIVIIDWIWFYEADCSHAPDNNNNQMWFAWHALGTLVHSFSILVPEIVSVENKSNETKREKKEKREKCD